jgi:hypothetical protein
MQNVNSFGFAELTSDETLATEGGVFPVLFVVWGVSVTVGHALAAGHGNLVLVNCQKA